MHFRFRWFKKCNSGGYASIRKKGYLFHAAFYCSYCVAALFCDLGGAKNNPSEVNPLFFQSYSCRMAVAHFKVHLLKNLPNVLEKQNKEIINQLIALHDKLTKNKALEKYFERNTLVELLKFTREKKRRIKQKISKLLKKSIKNCQTKIVLHNKCVAVLEHYKKVLVHCAPK
jgi:hypothetical protein